MPKSHSEGSARRISSADSSITSVSQSSAQNNGKNIIYRCRFFIWSFILLAVAGWLFRGFLEPGFPVVLDHPIHYAEFLYLVGTLLPSTGWISGWCDLHLAGFPMLVTYSVTGYLPGVFLTLCLGVGAQAAYKCAVFLAYAFPIIMLFVFLSRRFGAMPAALASLVWMLFPLEYVLCALGLWSQYWGIGFLLALFCFCDNPDEPIFRKNILPRQVVARTIVLGMLFCLIVISHVYSALAAAIFLAIWVPLNFRAGFPRWHHVLLAGGIAAGLGAFYLGPYWESGAWLVPRMDVKHFNIPFASLLRDSLLNLWDCRVLIVLEAGGVALTLRQWIQKKRIPAIDLSMLLFFFVALVVSVAPWRYLPVLRNSDFLANLIVHGPRSLLYAQFAGTFFAAAFFHRVMSFSKIARVVLVSALLIVLLPCLCTALGTPSPFLTLNRLPARGAVWKVEEWIQKEAPAGRGLVQNTVGNVPGLLGESHVTAVIPLWTGHPQIGDWISGLLYPHEPQFLTESGTLFGKRTGAVSNVDLLSQFQTHNITWAVACEPRLKARLESSGMFTKVREADPFAIYTLQNIFYNPAPWRSSIGGVVMQPMCLESNRMDWRLECPEDHVFITLKETFHPFWKAWVDGVSVTIAQNKNFQMVVEIPRRGSHILALRFEHPKKIWLWISALAVVACLVLLFFCGREKVV